MLTGVCVCVCFDELYTPLYYALTESGVQIGHQGFIGGKKQMDLRRVTLFVYQYNFTCPNCRSVDRLIRASRHYERAAQMLIRQTVATAREVGC